MHRINWRQAAGEAFLILLGILLALAADAWWNERSERTAEREYLAALETELGLLRDYALRTADGVSRMEESGRELLVISERWPVDPPTEDSIASLLADLGDEVDWTPPLTVYQDLVNTGSVRIIRSEDIRHGLTEIVGGVDWVSDRRDRHNEFFWSQLEPYLRAHVPVLRVFGSGELQTLSEPLSPGEFMGSREFQNIVAAKILSAVDVRAGTEDLVAVVDGVLALIALEGGRILNAADGPAEGGLLSRPARVTVSP